MKETIFKLTARWLPLLVLVAGVQVAASAQETNATKAARLLNESGHKFTKVSDAVWTVPFSGETQKNITVVASVSDEILVVFSVIAEKKSLNPTPELMQKLLQANSEYDYVKIGIDKDGDLFVRIDLTIRVMDKDELKMNLDQLAAVADAIHAAVKPHVVKPK